MHFSRQYRGDRPSWLIRSGAFAKTWIADMDNGEQDLRRRRAEAAGKQIETVGEELRALMRREDASAVR